MAAGQPGQMGRGVTAVIAASVGAIIARAVRQGSQRMAVAVAAHPVPIGHHHRTVGDVAEHQEDDQQAAQHERTLIALCFVGS